MRNAGPLNHIPWRVFAALLICLWIGFPAKSDTEKDRKKAAENLAKEIELRQFHKIYVPDFLDASGTRTEKGCYFASAFSTALANVANNFEVVNRIAAQKQLNELHISAQDFQQHPEGLTRVATALGVDAVLVGSASISSTDARLSLSLRDTSGKEVHAMDYQERLPPTFEGGFPPTQSEGGIYYFPGLDGVSQLKCVFCPNPDFRELARKGIQPGIQRVLLSARIDEKGKVKEVRVVSSPDDTMTRLCLDRVRDWRMKPSQDINRNAVQVRTVIEIVFRMLN